MESLVTDVVAAADRPQNLGEIEENTFNVLDRVLVISQWNLEVVCGIECLGGEGMNQRKVLMSQNTT